MSKPTRPLVVILLITAAHYFHHQITALVVPLLPFMRDGFDLTYTQAGALVSAFSLSYGIGQLPAGWLADRIGPRYLLLAGIAGVAAAGILAGLSQSYLWLIVFLIVMGIMGGGYHPSATPIISLAVPSEQRGRAMGTHLIAGSASHLVAPLLGVAIAGVLGWRGSFIAISIPVLLLGIVVFVVFGRLRFEDRAPAPMASHAESGTRSREAARVRVQVIFVVAMTSSIAALTSSILAFVPLYMVDVIGMSEAYAAVGLALFFSAGLWAAPLSGVLADRFGDLAVFGVVAVVAGPLIALLGFSHSAVLSLVALFFMGAGMFARMTVSESYLVGILPPARRSTVLGIYFFAGMEGSGIVTPVLGNMIDRFGFQRSFSMTGVVLIVIIGVLAVGLLWSNRVVGARYAVTEPR